MTKRCSALLALAAGLVSAQAIRVTGEVKQPLTLTAADLAKMPRASVHVTIHGVEATYAGVWLHDVLGYQVLFSLAELDPFFIDNQVLLADTADALSCQRTSRLLASSACSPHSKSSNSGSSP